jgi:hypothetical protein
MARFTWLCFRHRDKINNSSAAQNWTFHAENFTSAVSLYGQGRETEDRRSFIEEQCVILSERSRREIFVKLSLYLAN